VISCYFGVEELDEDFRYSDGNLLSAQDGEEAVSSA